ncbi:putative bifunctional diguanylate cyclase/phosphodiesterase [Pseudogulbenkiania sp. NH8B]|uniref:putative bifunctional diguanylate cyclase/phosphodiesterase n=1 Tax=Pseudogulbenkiania sp. (strain NH8B) TaxID=748280 RepID=UPI0005A15D59|nr:EAL domain-containing protein [Pseudogulbenkiania sp. NH8B]
MGRQGGKVAENHLGTNAKLLVVDDEPRMRESLCLLLRGRNYDVRACHDGQSALEQLMAGGVDLMLLDLHLGDMNGLDLLGMIRRAGIDTEVLVVSGDTAFDSAVCALRSGASDYVCKPYAVEELMHRVELALQRRSLARANLAMALQLHTSERMHRSLVEASPDLIFTLDERFCFTFANERSHGLIGYSPQELLGQSLLDLVLPVDAERVRYVLEHRTGQRAIEFRIVSRGGEIAERHFEASLVPVALDLPQLSSRLYGVARDVTDKKHAEHRMAYLAYHDLLTGLPNRALFRDRLGLAIMQAKRKGRQVAVLFVDLDRFKLANDTFGHIKGDELLKQVGQRLQCVLRECDTLARLGGDEFTILLPDLSGKEDAALLAGKLVKEVAAPFSIDGDDVFLTVSIGIAVFPDDGDDIETLLRHADIAMYQVKAQGKNGFGFFLPVMDAAASQRLRMENEVRRALELEQFELYYQPQVEFDSRRIIGCEALIRWPHPTRGLVPPGAFLGVIEEIGLMKPLTYWVIERACQTLREWKLAGLELSRMSVNVPPELLVDDDFYDYLIATVDRYGIRRQSFEIEITENAFIADQQAMSLKLAGLAEEGIRVAIDDFGTQYSSLSYLRHLPVTTLKIDQSFVREIEAGKEDSPIVRAIVAIATGLNLNLVAEGVETEVQADYLGSLGAVEMQGYLFGKPMPASDFRRLLHQEAAVMSV